MTNDPVLEAYGLSKFLSGLFIKAHYWWKKADMGQVELRNSMWIGGNNLMEFFF